MPVILVADDEPMVRRLVRQMLQPTGHEVLEAEDGLAAYNLIREQQGAFDLLITDIVMPHMDGAELVRRIESEYPELKILCISGYADRKSPNGHYFLPKPFTPVALRAMVEKVLGVSVKEHPQFARTEERSRHQSDLHVRLVAAEAKLKAADEEYNWLALCSDAVDNPTDGAMALRQAMAVRLQAFSEYSKALQEWHEFLKSTTRLRTPFR